MPLCRALVGVSCLAAAGSPGSFRTAVKGEMSTASSFSSCPLQLHSWTYNRRGGEISTLTPPWQPLKSIRLCHAGATGGLNSSTEDWSKLLPEKKLPLYSHSLPCIEAWLKDFNFYQSKDDRSVWLIERPDWHAQLSLDITELYIRYLKSGPGNLDRDVERKFSYALSREDVENAILGGP